jgi:hypothetical protein
LKKEEDCYDDLLQEYFPIEADPEFIDLWQKKVDGYESEEVLTEPSTSSEESIEDPVASNSEKDVANDDKSESGEESKGPDVIFGSAKLEKGEVVVSVPDSFEWEDYYYQVTPIGKWAPVYIKNTLKDGKFTIASNDQSDVTVHWQIRGESW